MTFQSIRSIFIRQVIYRKPQQHAIRPLINLLTLLSVIQVIVGCGKSSTPPAKSDPQPSSVLHPPSALSPLFRLHWLGKIRLAAESNATNFISIWNMPESLRLEAQTLDKLSTAPWRLLATQTPMSNAPSALLRPLLDDLVQQETYLEISAGTNSFIELVLAIKLPSGRAAVWQANLPIILKSIFREASETKVSVADYQLLTKDHQLTLTRSGDWTLLSIGTINHQPSTINLASSIVSRLTNATSPCDQPATTHWLHGNLDLGMLARIARWSILTNENLPTCEFSATGDGAKVRTHAIITFPSQAPIELEPWNIPTNLVHDPLIGFMAVRGFRPLLNVYGLWNESKFGVVPNQATFWSQSGNSAFKFFALPSSQSGQQLKSISESIVNDMNPLMALNPHLNNMPLGGFEFIAEDSQLRWKGLPMFSPNMYISVLASNAFIAGGMFQNRLTNIPPPVELIAQFRSESDMLLYDWEVTGPNAYGLIQMTQVGRAVLGRSRLSMTNNAVLPWITATHPRLFDSRSSARLVAPETIAFARTSTVGLTGLEIHILAEWLESPDFPKGLFTINSGARSPMPPRPTSSKP